MKKIFFSAALAAMMMASCQNENLVNSNEMQEEFTVEVTKGMDSRVYMDGSVAKWSADDALYVYGTNGVRGTLYLTSGANSKTATFTGVISGSSKNLTNAIFGNVTHNGDNISLTLSNVDASQCDAPMFGAFSADKGSINLDYICGLVPVKITEDENGNLSNVKLGGVGVSTLTLVNGEWVPGTAYADITLTNVPDGETFYVPFFTTEEESKTPLTITVGNKSYTYIANTEAGSISTTTAPELILNNSGELEAEEESETTQPSAVVVKSSDELAQAINAKESNVFLMPGKYEVDLYNIEFRNTLSIVGSKGTQITFDRDQVLLYKFNNFSIDNCEILKMKTKSWGMMVLDRGVDNGVYTISNCTFNGVGTQGIYLNEYKQGVVYNIEYCTFNGDFGKEGAIVLQNNKESDPTVNVKGCTFYEIPETSHAIFVFYDNNSWTLNTDAPEKIYYAHKEE